MAAKITLTKQFVHVGQRVLKLILPKNRFGDRVFSFFDFLVQHQRFPKKGFIFNDVMYRIKSTNEILDPLRVFVSDKEFVKIYVKSIVGEKYAVPTIAVLRTADEIGCYDFPSDCCIKPTHLSGNVILRRENSPIDKIEIIKWLHLNHYEKAKEANYRYLAPKVIVEPLLFDSTNVEDYKIFCFNGEPKLVQVDVDRFGDHKRLYFDPNWIPQSYSIQYPIASKKLAKPNNLNEMLDVARKASVNFNFVRVDLYSNGVDCFVGEITNCHAGAREKFLPPSAEVAVSKILFGAN